MIDQHIFVVETRPAPEIKRISAADIKAAEALAKFALKKGDTLLSIRSYPEWLEHQKTRST